MNIDAIYWMGAAFAFVFGAVVGSFLNVVIYRVPAGLSVVSPPSRCPVCESQIRWYDNIPIISWALLLRGKCRDCGTPIPARYALVEALTGVLTAALWFKVAHPFFTSVEVFTQTPAINYLLPFGLYFFFLCLMVVITFVDLDHTIIPHKFTLPGMAVGVAVPFLFNWLLEPGALADFWPKVTVFESVVGLIAGGLAVIVIFYAYFALRGIAGIGGGDVTLMAVVGAWLGWPALIFVFFAASMQGTLAAVAAMIFGGSSLLRDHGELLADEEEQELREEAAERFEADTVAELEEPSEPAVESPDTESPAADEPAEDEPAEDEATDEDQTASPMAVPFGPFIALAAVEHFFIGDLLPSALSMSYLYEFGHW
ncbi:hypothetical protein FIV42_04370 [Persicimonas caeni]|uniref:Prepilin peptidase n=1 Tax=Persicimonas caeni TaxID=2292766 RepID=A0A4Y6PNV3_PERCE|nr:A24 family peptidase [Persicimonas caeni]QDG50001.1 hypothetical protein FIV42_04370 [Persicimonas caeni]QED31222.1 hypothetical protein FRD00_04365 [Persicimonas caeni]